MFKKELASYTVECFTALAVLYFHFFARFAGCSRGPFVAGILLDQLAEFEIALGNQQFLHQHFAAGEEDPAPFPNQFLSYSISVEEHTSMAPRPRRESRNPPLLKSSAIPA